MRSIAKQAGTIIEAYSGAFKYGTSHEPQLDYGIVKKSTHFATYSPELSTSTNTTGISQNNNTVLPLDHIAPSPFNLGRRHPFSRKYGASILHSLRMSLSPPARPNQRKILPFL